MIILLLLVIGDDGAAVPVQTVYSKGMLASRMTRRRMGGNRR